MTIQYTINNYTLGAKLKSCPTDKVIFKQRIDEGHTLVVFGNMTVNEKAFCDKCFARKGTPYGPAFKGYIKGTPYR